MSIAVTVADTAWHSLETSDVLSSIGLSSVDEGLSTQEAERRLAEFGKNVLTPPKKPSWLGKLWAQVC